MINALIISFAAVGLGVPIGLRMELNPMAVGILCGGLDALFNLIFR